MKKLLITLNVSLSQLYRPKYEKTNYYEESNLDIKNPNNNIKEIDEETNDEPPASDA